MFPSSNLNFHGTGFNVETIEYKNISFTVWDVGGQDKVLKTRFLFSVFYNFAYIGLRPSMFDR